MKWLRSIFDFYLDASIHVALAVVCLYFISIQILELNFNLYLAGFIGLSTVVCYNFVKYGVEAEKYLIVSNSYHKIIQIFSFISFILFVHCALQLNREIWWATGVLTILSVVYALPVLPNAKNIRSLGVLKIFIVALVWMGFTVILPIIDNHQSWTWDTTVIAIQRFLLVLVLILPFEIRDKKFDAKEMRTVPQRLGLSGTKKLGYVLLVLFFGLSFLRDEIQNTEIVMRLLISVILAFLMNITREEQSKYFASFWVESVPILWGLLLFFAQSYFS